MNKSIRGSHCMNHLLKPNPTSYRQPFSSPRFHCASAAPFPTKNGHGNGHGAARRSRVALGARGYSFGILMAPSRPQGPGLGGQNGGWVSIQTLSVQRPRRHAGARTLGAAPSPLCGECQPNKEMVQAYRNLPYPDKDRPGSIEPCHLRWSRQSLHVD